MITLIRFVASSWAASERENARAWALELPVGAARDSALRGVLLAPGTSTIDVSVLDSINDTAIREHTATTLAVRVARSDPAAANRLLERYVTDHAARQQAQQEIDRAIGSGSQPVIVRQ